MVVLHLKPIGYNAVRDAVSAYRVHTDARSGFKLSRVDSAAWPMRRGHGIEGAVANIPWIMLGSVVAVVLAIRGPRLKPFFGALERLFYVSSITWVLVVGIDLVRTSRVARPTCGPTIRLTSGKPDQSTMEDHLDGAGRRLRRARPRLLFTVVRPQADGNSQANPSGSVRGPASLPMTMRCEPVPSGSTPASSAAARRL